MGYSYTNQNIPYLKNIVDNRKQWIQIVSEADCVLINPGSSDYWLTEYCVKNSKTVFIMSERIFKRGLLKVFDIRLWRQVKINIESRGKNVYLLCLGSFVARDFSQLGFQRKHAYKFGYFPQSEGKINIQNKVVTDKLLWVGRMIDWKRPLFAVKIVERLNKQGYKYNLTIVGDGPLKTKVSKYVNNHKLQDCIELVGLKSNNEVRNMMLEFTALISTSTRREGWGAVINEALDAGLPVISGAEVGAAGYLLQNGNNGYLFSTYSIQSAVDAIKKMENNNLIELRVNAKSTLKQWNAETAGERFLQVLNLIEGGNSSPDVFVEGPMSKA